MKIKIKHPEAFASFLVAISLFVLALTLQIRSDLAILFILMGTWCSVTGWLKLGKTSFTKPKVRKHLPPNLDPTNGRTNTIPLR